MWSAPTDNREATSAMRAAAYPAEDPGTLKTPEDLLPLYLYLLGPDSKTEHGRTFTSDWINL